MLPPRDGEGLAGKGCCHTPELVTATLSHKNLKAGKMKMLRNRTEKDLVIVKMTHGTYNTSWQFCHVCPEMVKRHKNGTKRWPSEVYAATSRTDAEASATVAARSGRPSRPICPNCSGDKRNPL